MQRLSERMIEDMKLAGLAERTQESYLASMRGLVAHYGGRAPGLLTPEEVRGYFLHLVEAEKSASTVRVRLNGVRFFFERTLRRDWAVFDGRILEHTAETVAVACRDATTGEARRLTVAPLEFMRRCLQHVPPSRQRFPAPMPTETASPAGVPDPLQRLTPAGRRPRRLHLQPARCICNAGCRSRHPLKTQGLPPRVVQPGLCAGSAARNR